MSVSKDVLKQCIINKQHEVDEAVIVYRQVEFEDNGNYVIVGVRHTGKSYLLYQRVKQLQAKGLGWDEMLFVDFEDERLAEFQTEDFNSLLEAHLELYGKKPVVFLDEVQNIDHWDKFVRRLADANYRVYVTGSNAKMLSKEVATTLGGRFFIYDVYPYSLKEYLAAQQVELSEHWEYDTIQRSEVKRHLNNYFYYGGLPEILLFKNKRAMLSSLYQKIYLGDICARNSIKSDRVMSILIKKMAESVKQPLSFNRLKNVIVATGSSISAPTTVDYVGYAADSWLILPIENEIGKLTEKESQKKYYFIDNGLLNLFLINPETSLLENMVAVELCRRYGKDNVYFLNAEKEIDFVVPNEKLAIQASYSINDDATKTRQIAPLVKYRKKHPDWQCLLITYDEEDSLDDIPVVPVWKWLLKKFDISRYS
ncbi:MAG: ATP-binding protein [Bacteroidales bacterium]|nr:ATP-binding protein [Bacteroidales bacterium]